MIENTSNQDPLTTLAMGIVFGGPGAIEAQEAQGQRQLVASSQLPAEANEREKDASKLYEAMGIKVAGRSRGDELFLDVELPAGWSIKPTDHSMWSEVFDDKGCKRIGVFYKAAFYDRSAHANIIRRYGVDYVQDPSNDGHSKRVVVDQSTGQVLFDTKFAKWGGETSEECHAWLKANFPDYQNPLAYW